MSTGKQGALGPSSEATVTLPRSVVFGPVCVPFSGYVVMHLLSLALSGLTLVTCSFLPGLLCYLLLVHILLFPLSGLREVLDVPI